MDAHDLPQAEFVERNACISCGSRNLRPVATGRYMDTPLRDFMMEDPGGERVLPFLRNAEWALVSCAECGQVFHRFILNDEWNSKRFSEWMDPQSIAAFEERLDVSTSKVSAAFTAAQRHVEHVVRLERLTRSLRGSDRVRLLDFGCGWGGFLSVCNSFGFEAIGVDRSAARRGGSHLEVFASLHELQGLPAFHVITLFEVLEHLDQPGDMLRELASYLAPGGILVLETPDCSGVHDIQTREDYRKVHPLDHINAFTPKSLQAIAGSAGFRLIPRGAAYVTTDLWRVVKRASKHLLLRDGRSTQFYFEKL